MPQNTFLFVRSADRVAGTSSRFTVNCPQTYKNVTACSLVSAELPTVYNVDTIFCAGVTITYNGTSLALVISAGFYTIADIVAWLLATLQGSLSAAGVTAVTYSTTTGKISIVYSGTQAFSIQNNSAGSFGRILGTDPLGLVTFGTGGVLTLPYIATLAPMNTILLRIGELPNICTSTNNQHSTFRLQIAAAAGSLNFQNAASSTFNNCAYNAPVLTVPTLTISLWTAEGNQIDLRGIEWTFTILLTSS